jgi:hypothetical protein
MYKKMFAMMLIALFAVVSLWNAQPAAAFSGVQGRAFDGYGDPWTHGGQVYVFNNTTGQLVASGDLVTGDPVNNGRFDFPYTQTTNGGNGVAPLQGHAMSIYIVYTDGGVGTPPLAQRDYTELAFITGRYSAGNFDTGTGPSAVTLNSIGVATGNGIAIYLVVGVMMALMATAVLVARRNQTS